MPKTRTAPLTHPAPVPSMVRLLTVTSTVFSTSNCTATGPSDECVPLATRPPGGTVMTAALPVPSVTPVSVKGSVMTTCSGYVPGQTLTWLPAATLLTAD